jgi:hypothetical protein
MNKKQLILVIGLGIILALVAASVVKKQASPYTETAKEGAKLLGDFDLNSVAAVSIKNSTNEIVVTKKDDVWVVKQRHDYPANFGTVSEVVKKFWELKVARAVKAGPSRLPALELAGPEKGSTLVEFKDASGKVIRSVLLGAKSMKESSGNNAFGGGAWPNGRYVMVGNDIKTVALVGDALSNVDPKPEDWISKDWFKVEKIRSISMTSTNATNSWKVAREVEAGELKLADKKEGEEIDTSKLSSVGFALSSPSFNDVLSPEAKPEETGMDNPSVATLETFDNFVYNVKIGKKKEDENYHLKVAVTANIAKERTPGKDEKPEDKEKLDKEFKEKVTKLEEKLKQEQAYEKWTYLVAKWTIDPLLKERKEFYAEKKEEPKKEEPTADDLKNAAPPKEEPKKEATTLVPSPLPEVKIEDKK